MVQEYRLLQDLRRGLIARARKAKRQIEEATAVLAQARAHQETVQRRVRAQLGEHHGDGNGDGNGDVDQGDKKRGPGPGARSGAGTSRGWGGGGGGTSAPDVVTMDALHDAQVELARTYTTRKENFHVGPVRTILSGSCVNG